MMTTFKFFVPHRLYAEINTLIRENKVKHWPHTRGIHEYEGKMSPGYWITIEDDQLASYIALKY